MPFPELVAVKCQACGEGLRSRHVPPGTKAATSIAGVLKMDGGALFRSQSDAARAAGAAGWYVDARSERCPKCQAKHLRRFEVGALAGAVKEALESGDPLEAVREAVDAFEGSSSDTDHEPPAELVASWRAVHLFDEGVEAMIRRWRDNEPGFRVSMLRSLAGLSTRSPQGGENELPICGDEDTSLPASSVIGASPPVMVPGVYVAPRHGRGERRAELEELAERQRRPQNALNFNGTWGEE